MNEAAMRRCIERKRDGGELSAQVWSDAVTAFLDGRVDDAQMTALCMACVIRGMTFAEAHALTDAMVRSGETISFPRERGVVVDKHSSGGVGDIVTLVAVPLAAAAGARVAKLSGRALGHTGGTIDKLEAIPGFDVTLDADAFVAQVERIGCAIVAQSDAIVPADKRLYRLRDRTGTIPAMGLLASSIACKKIAGGAHAFIFDVKTGPAAFLDRVDDAFELAAWLVEISSRFGRRARAFLTGMYEPLGRTIGTGIELVEARDLLRTGKGDPHAREVAVAIASAMAEECGVADAEACVERALTNGSGYAKFCDMVEAQRGDVAAFERMRFDEGARITVASPAAGYVRAIDVVRLGNAARRLSSRDPLGGLRIEVRIGDYIERGAPLAHVYAPDRDTVATLATAFKFSETPVKPAPLILSR